MDHTCFESPGNPGVIVGMFFERSLPFAPDRLFFEYRMFNSGWDYKDHLEQHIDFQRVERNCERHGLTLPKVDKKGENVAVEIKMFSDDHREFLIDWFNIIVSPDFRWKHERITGLHGWAAIDVKFAPHKKELKFARSPHFEYFKLIGKLKAGEGLCLKFFKTGKTVVLEVKGAKLYDANIYDQYVVELYHKSTDSKEVHKRYFAKGYKCGDNEKLGQLLMYVNDFNDGKDPVPEVQISVHDYRHTENWEIRIPANKDENANVNIIGDVYVYPVKVLARTIEQALQGKDGIMVYPLKADLYYCYEDHKESFVALWKFNSTLVETSSQFKRLDQSTDQIIVMHSGTQDQINKCLQKK